MKKNNKGFTLAELLIVVAIIAVLVAISIPIFSTQLEKSREAVDIANVRSCYAEILTAALTDDKTAEFNDTQMYNETDGTYTATVDLVQKVDDWTTATANLNIGGIKFAEWQGVPTAEGDCVLTFIPKSSTTEETFTIKWE